MSIGPDEHAVAVAKVAHAAVRVLDGRHDGVDAGQEAPGALNC